MAKLTDNEWQALIQGIDTPSILDAVGKFDQLSAEVAHSEDGGFFLKSALIYSSYTNWEWLCRTAHERQ